MAASRIPYVAHMACACVSDSVMYITCTCHIRISYVHKLYLCSSCMSYTDDMCILHGHANNACHVHMSSMHAKCAYHMHLSDAYRMRILHAYSESFADLICTSCKKKVELSLADQMTLRQELANSEQLIMGKPQQTVNLFADDDIFSC